MHDNIGFHIKSKRGMTESESLTKERNFLCNLIPAVANGPGWPAGKPMSETLSWDPCLEEGIPQKEQTSPFFY